MSAQSIDYADDYQPKGLGDTPTIEASCRAIWTALAKRRALEGDFAGASRASVAVEALKASWAVGNATTRPDGSPRPDNRECQIHAHRMARYKSGHSGPCPSCAALFAARVAKWEAGRAS